MSAKKLLKKSALALAIASVSVAAYAESVILTSSNSSYENTGDLLSGLTVTGNSTFVATDGGSEVVVSIIDAQVAGNIVVDAAINLSGPDATALEIGSESTQTIINGDITNKGQISFTGDVGWGVNVYAGEDDVNPGPKTQINGSIVNEGTIKLTQIANPSVTLENDPATAIEVSFTDLEKMVSIVEGDNDPDRDPIYGIENSLVGKVNTGGIYNKSNIVLSGDNVTGIYSTNHSYMGVIENRDSITGTGKNVRGIHVDNGSVVELIENYGTISVSSAGKTEQVGDYVMDPSGAIVVENAAVLFIDNEESGVINASGADVSGIYVGYGSEVYEIENEGKITATNGANAITVKGAYIDLIDNDGTIEVEGPNAVGIYLENNQSADYSDKIVIRNKGNITADNRALAIKVANLSGYSFADVDLDWVGGRIDGNIEGITSVNIENGVVFGGAQIYARNINVNKSDSVGNAGTNLTFINPHTTLNVDAFNVNPGTNLILEISKDTNAEKAIVSVTGDADFEKDSSIKINSAKNFSTVNQDYILVEAGDLADEGLKVVAGSDFLTVNSFKSNEKQVIANVSIKNGGAIAEDVKAAGGNKASQALAKELDVFFEAIGKTNPELYAAMEAAGTAAAAEMLSPDVSGAGVQAASTGQNIITSATGSRSSSLRGKSSGEALKETGVWMQTLYSDASQGTRDGIKGYNAYSSGLAIGADGKPSDDVTVGVAYSYLNTTVNGKSNSTTDVKGHAFTLYGGYEMGNYFVDGNLTYSTNTNDSKRNVFGTVAKGDYDSDMLGASVTGGYTFNLDNNFVVEPLVAARYANIKIDSFTEKGPAALRTGSQRYEIAELGLGARASTNYAVGQGNLEPQVQVMALHDLAADQTKSNSAFVAAGNTFKAPGAKPVRNSYEASVGADYRLGALTFGANYGYTGKTGFNADTFSAKVRYDF